MTTEPTKDDISNARYFIGLNKPRPVTVDEPEDPYLYQKWQGAKKYGISMDAMADEPDEMSDHSDDQGFDN